MAAYRRVYDSPQLQADCQEPGSAPKPYARQSSVGYLYLFYCLRCRVMICRKCQSVGHSKHDSEDVKAVAQRFARSLEDATGPVLVRIDQYRAAMERRQPDDWQAGTVIYCGTLLFPGQVGGVTQW